MSEGSTSKRVSDVIDRLVREGSAVARSDGSKHELPAIARAAAFYVANLGWSLEDVSSADPLHEWAVLHTSSAPDTRAFDYYVDF